MYQKGIVNKICEMGFLRVVKDFYRRGKTGKNNGQGYRNLACAHISYQETHINLTFIEYLFRVFFLIYGA